MTATCFLLLYVCIFVRLYDCIFFVCNFKGMVQYRTRLTYNCAHLRSTKESLTDSVKILFVRKKICVKIFLG